MASASRANWCAEREVVPLKTMCSTKWEMPFRTRDSSREPESIQTPMETERTWGMDSVRTSRPLGRRVRRMLRAGDAVERAAVVRVADMRLLILREGDFYCVTRGEGSRRGEGFSGCRIGAGRGKLMAIAGGARAGVRHDQPSTQRFCFASGDPGCDGGVERGCRVGAGGGVSAGADCRARAQGFFVVLFLFLFLFVYFFYVCFVLVFFALNGAGDLVVWDSGDACDCE